MKEKHKKTIIFILVFLIISILSIFAYMYYKEANTVHFIINGEEKTKHAITLEYEDNLVLDCKKIGLSAIRNKKDITDLIIVGKHNLSKLKTYDVDFYIEDKDLAIFTCSVKVVDTTAPIISGETQYTLTQQDSFDESVLNLSASDNYDKDLTSKITCNKILDTSSAGEHTLIYSVEDSSGNRSEHVVTIIVEEKPAPPQTPIYTQNNSVNVVSNPNDITLLINKNYALPDGWAPSDLIHIGGNHYLRYEAAMSLANMQQAAFNEGVGMNVVSTYRSQTYQYNLFNSYMACDPANAPYYSAPPRSSEHELGLAIDISYDWQLHNDLQNSQLGIWMEANAYRFGWILRYPNGKTHITGYVFEPWHYRYVGIDLATQLKSSNLTLEEYYGG